MSLLTPIEDENSRKMLRQIALKTDLQIGPEVNMMYYLTTFNVKDLKFGPGMMSNIADSLLKKS